MFSNCITIQWGVKKKDMLQEVFTQVYKRDKTQHYYRLNDHQWWTNQALVKMAAGFYKPPEEV